MRMTSKLNITTDCGIDVESSFDWLLKLIRDCCVFVTNLWDWLDKKGRITFLTN